MPSKGDGPPIGLMNLYTALHTRLRFRYATLFYGSQFIFMAGIIRVPASVVSGLIANAWLALTASVYVVEQ